jgi:hypothetical protein
MEAALPRADRGRALLVEFVCKGVPSLRVFHRYLGELFAGEAVTSYTFRDKAASWHGVKATSATGRRYEMAMPADAFGRGFNVENLFVMEACHACPFARMPRGGDITVGDFWGCPDAWNDRRGVSVVLANTQAGLDSLERVGSSGRLELRRTDVATATARNPRAVGGAYPIPRNRRRLLDDLASGASFEHLVRKYYPGRWRLAVRSFRQSESRTRWAVQWLARQFRRLTRRPPANAGTPRA